MRVRCALALCLAVQATLGASNPLLIIAPAAPAGGWDQTARAMQRVLAEIEPGASVQVDNIPGRIRVATPGCRRYRIR